MEGLVAYAASDDEDDNLVVAEEKKDHSQISEVPHPFDSLVQYEKLISSQAQEEIEVPNFDDWGSFSSVAPSDPQEKGDDAHKKRKRKAAPTIFSSGTAHQAARPYISKRKRATDELFASAIVPEGEGAFPSLHSRFLSLSRRPC